MLVNDIHNSEDISGSGHLGYGRCRERKSRTIIPGLGVIIVPSPIDGATFDVGE